MSVFDKIKRVFGKSTGNKSLPVDVVKAVGYSAFENYYSSGELSSSLYFNEAIDYICRHLTYFNVFKSIDINLLRRQVYDYFIFGQVCFYKDGYDGRLHILRGHSITYVYTQDDGLEKFIGTNEWNKRVELYPYEAGFVSRPRVNDYLYGVRGQTLLQQQLDIEAALMRYASVSQKTAGLGQPIVSYKGELPTLSVYEQNNAQLQERSRSAELGIPRIQHLSGDVQIQSPDIHNVSQDFPAFNQSIKQNIYEYFGLSCDQKDVESNILNSVLPLVRLLLRQINTVYSIGDVNELDHPAIRENIMRKSSGVVQLWNIGIPAKDICQLVGIQVPETNNMEKDRFCIDMEVSAFKQKIQTSIGDESGHRQSGDVTSESQQSSRQSLETVRDGSVSQPEYILGTTQV